MVNGNTDGDTTMILIASTDQYSNEFTFLISSSSTTDYISITVPTDYYSLDSIIYDDQVINGNEWQPVYDIDNSTIVGYGCNMVVTSGLHTLLHTDSEGKFFVLVYGFGSGRAYGYPAGLTFPSFKGNSFILILLMISPLYFLFSIRFEVF